MRSCFRVAALGLPGLDGQTYKIDASKPLAEINWIVAPSEILKGIYKIDGDTLTMCITKDLNGPRPTLYEAGADSKFVLWTLKRAATKKD